MERTRKRGSDLGDEIPVGVGEGCRGNLEEENDVGEAEEQQGSEEAGGCGNRRRPTSANRAGGPMPPPPHWRIIAGSAVAGILRDEGAFDGLLRPNQAGTLSTGGVLWNWKKAAQPSRGHRGEP